MVVAESLLEFFDFPCRKNNPPLDLKFFVSPRPVTKYLRIMSKYRAGDFLFNVVLVEPEIPQNTGNIGRTCVGTHSHLHLVGKLGFDLSDRQVKRAGLDYWQHLKWLRHDNWETWWEQVSDPTRVYFFSTKGEKNLYDITLRQGDWLVFGSETKGLRPEVIQCHRKQLVKIPFPGPIRSFNLANAVSMALGEGLRQLHLMAL